MLLPAFVLVVMLLSGLEVPGTVEGKIPKTLMPAVPLVLQSEARDPGPVYWTMAGKGLIII